jgi:uncharacterized protein YidB (DUF937 family)
MELADIVNMGTELFKSKLGDSAGEIDQNTVMDALSGLISNKEGGIDLSNILSSLTSSDGVGSIISSWMGDGENEPVDGSQLTEILGEDKVSEFADKLGVDKDTALSGLTDAIPNMIDKATGEGSLLDAVGGIDGIMDMASKFFGSK